MASPFTPKIDGNITEGLKACQKCAEITKILRAAEIPAEPTELQNEYYTKVLENLKRLRDEIAAQRN